MIDRLSLSIDQGQTFALVGESGSGKSMTALALLRLLPEGLRIREGKVLMGDDDLFALRESDMLRVRGRRIGMIFQEPSTSLNPVMTIGQQLLEVIERHGLARAAAARELALEWFARVGLPEPERQLHAYPFELSGGQKQRAMIAIALAAQPELLIADEPTTALDVSLQAQIMALLKQLQQERGMAMLLITHDLALVSDVADHLALMYAGQIVESRASRDFFAEPRHPYGRLLLRALPKASDRGRALAAIEGLVPSLRQTFAGCRFASRCPWVLESCMHQLPTLNAERGVRCFRDAELAASGDRLRLETFDNRPSKSGTKLLEVRGLAVRYRRSGGWFEAVGGVDLELRRGETLALVGESGCGKTTIGKALMGLLPEDAKLEGQALFSEDGLSLIPRDQRRRLQIQLRMQMIFQDPFASLNPRMRIQQVLEEGILALRQSLQAQERSEAIRLLLEQVGLEPEVLNRYPHEFSGGQRQRIAIARALAVEPSLLICDEPTSALDVSVQAQILNLLVRLRDRLGLSLIFITHNIGVVEYLADHVAVMHQGRILEQGRADEVLEHPRQDYTRSLLASVPRLQR
ncbi:MAG: ABC transporter ATP-binding protein [Betaproteobacteria bacterium]|nr:ABC transporter ATP-binding protein [Betaproteobacteria bacterium]